MPRPTSSVPVPSMLALPAVPLRVPVSLAVRAPVLTPPRAVFPARWLWVVTLFFAIVPRSPALALDAEPARPEIPSYTDLDLARYSHERGDGETAGTPSPASDSDQPARRSGRRSARREPHLAGAEVADLQREAEERASEERYWRREADRARERVRRLEASAEELEATLEERKRAGRKSGAADPGLASLPRRIESARSQARQLWEAFEDRARRERALPGWIR